MPDLDDESDKIGHEVTDCLQEVARGLFVSIRQAVIERQVSP